VQPMISAASVTVIGLLRVLFIWLILTETKNHVNTDFQKSANFFFGVSFRLVATRHNYLPQLPPDAPRDR
jgi:hypothetical protein